MVENKYSLEKKSKINQGVRNLPQNTKSLVRDGPLENLWGEVGGRSTKKEIRTWEN